MHEVDQCLLCGSKDVENINDSRDVGHWNCPICGRVLVSGTAMAAIDFTATDIWLLSAYFRRQLKLGFEPEMLDTRNKSELTNKIFIPKSVDEKKAKIIEYFAHNSKFMGEFIQYDNSMNLDIVISSEELPYFLEYLIEEDLLESDIDLDRLSDGSILFNGIRLTPKGWELHEQIKSNPIESNRVFIAMWFNEETENLRQALRSSIKAAGYDPVIVDERHFTGNIMDYIIGQIKQSKFVIADFTVQREDTPEMIDGSDEAENTKVRRGSRGGVYYEAGFARGLGLNVINTCRDNNISKNRLHFDIIQDNTLFWKPEEIENNRVRTMEERSNKESPINFSEKLFDRIVQLYGYGSNV